MSIKYKLLLLLLFSIVIPMLITVSFSYQSIYSRIEREFIAQNTLRANQVNQSFEKSIQELDNKILSIYQTKELYSFITDPPAGSDELIAQQRKVENLLKILTHSLEEFSRVYLYTTASNLLYTVDARYLTVDHVELPQTNKPSWIEAANHRNGALAIIQETTEGKDEAKLFVGRSIPDVIEKVEEGVLGIELNHTYFESIVGELTREHSVRITDQGGNTLYATSDVSIDDPNYIRIISETNKNGWQVMMFIPKKIFEETAWQAVRPIIVWGIAFHVLAILLWYLFARQISLPLLELVKGMKTVGTGNFKLEDLTVKKVRKDEIGYLENQFRSMLLRIDDLIKQEYEWKMKESEAQIKALQAQINPHFLYNTLTSIYSEAMEANAPSVCKMIKSLSSMFRYTTEQHHNTVTLSEEMDHIRNYLEIQKFRFEDNLHYDIQIPSAMLARPTVKLSLQPIVENAVMHGISKKGQGTILIRAWEHLDVITVEVEDNAGLLSKEQAQELTTSLQCGSMEQNHIGLSSVHARIQHLMPESEGIRMDVHEGSTRVKVSWKVVEMNENFHH